MAQSVALRSSVYARWAGQQLVSRWSQWRRRPEAGPARRRSRAGPRTGGRQGTGAAAGGRPREWQGPLCPHRACRRARISLRTRRPPTRSSRPSSAARPVNAGTSRGSEPGAASVGLDLLGHGDPSVTGLPHYRLGTGGMAGSDSAEGSGTRALASGYDVQPPQLPPGELWALEYTTPSVLTTQIRTVPLFCCAAATETNWPGESPFHTPDQPDHGPPGDSW